MRNRECIMAGRMWSGQVSYVGLGRVGWGGRR